MKNIVIGLTLLFLAVTANSADWYYHVEKDKMTDEVTHAYAQLWASNGRDAIIVEKKGRKYYVSIHTGGIVGCHINADCSVQIRFDSNKVEQVMCVYDGIIFRPKDEGDFLNKLLRAKRVLMKTQQIPFINAWGEKVDFSGEIGEMSTSETLDLSKLK